MHLQGVLIYPGQTELTRMPSFPYAQASVRVIPNTAALVAAYLSFALVAIFLMGCCILTAPTFSCDTRPKIDDMLTMEPL